MESEKLEYLDFYKSEFGVAKHCTKSFGLAVWKHQQSKVDELQAKFDQHDQWLGQRNKDVQELYDIIVKHAAEKGELQKRVDASLIAFEKLKEEVNELHGQCDLHLIKYLEEKSQVLEQALKGGEDASN